MDLREFVLANVSSERYYQARFPHWTKSANPNVTCPFHDDQHPSLSVDTIGGGAKCWATSCTSGPWGNIIHFHAAGNKITEAEAAIDIYDEFIRPVIPQKEVATLQQNLARMPTIQKAMLTELGISLGAIQKFGLGYDPSSKRISIPIFNQFGLCINIRRYLPPSARSGKIPKMVSYEKGYGGLELFPWPLFIRYDLAKPLFVFPSEKETIIAIDHGLQAICATCGEGAWNNDWNEYLLGYDIVIVPQNDEAGSKWCERMVATLQHLAKDFRVANIPEKKDFADWVVECKGHGTKLLIKSAVERNAEPPKSQGLSVAPELPEDSGETVELVGVSNTLKHLNKLVHTRGIVAAKANHSFTVPWRFQIRPKNAPTKIFSVKIGRDLAHFAGLSDKSISEYVQELFHLEGQVTSMAFITITEVEVIPIASIERDVPYVMQRCFFVGEWIDSNIPYEIEVIPTTEVKSQKTIGVIVSVVPISHTFENRKFKTEEFAMLQLFQPADGQSISDKLDEFAEVMANDFTLIRKRPDWHIATMLTWVSPIGFKFSGEDAIQRGHMNTLGLGDTQTGKSQVVDRTRAATLTGQTVNAENCTFVGLVGGAIKSSNGQLMLRWGKIPLCDKQLVVIEELSGMSIQDLSHMSDIRSSGIARLDKGGINASTNARTRIIALSNVRGIGKTLAGYTSGVRALQDLIGHGEDISRFDLIMTLVDSDVSVEEINQPIRRKKRSDITAEHLQLLVQWAWALKPEQIHITNDAYLACLDATQELSEKYHPSVPIFKGGSGRYKIARIAVAIATLQFSWNKGKVVINEEHVEAAVKFMQYTFDKHPLRYDEFSEQMFDREDVKDEGELDAALVAMAREAVKRSRVAESMIHLGKFTRDELCAIASTSIMTADSAIGALLRNRAIRQGEKNVWELTPAGKRWLDTHAKNGKH